MTSSDKIDAVIIGAGVVGAAVAQWLCSRGLQCWLLEQHARPGHETTSRNSGVIHAGLYYPQDSLRTRLCVSGNPMLYDWSARFKVAHRRCGKLIVARTAMEEAQLDVREAHARAVGVSKLRRLSQAEIHQRTGLEDVQAALFSENTGIIDPIELTRSLIAQSKNLELVLHAEVQSIRAQADGYLIDTSRGPIRAGIVVNSAGLRADSIARMVGVTKYRIYPVRGDYFRWRTKRRIDHLVYAVKAKNACGLGIHLTVGLDDSLFWGPDTEYVGDEFDYAPAEHKRAAFLKAVQTLYPQVQADDLSYETCGVRPKLRAENGLKELDFVIAEDLPGFVNLIGIESPGLTASLAIAQHVGQLLSA